MISRDRGLERRNYILVLRPAITSESGWTGDFEQEGAPQARFGAGWMVSTDQIAGGK